MPWARLDGFLKELNLNSFVVKTLPLTLMRSRLWREILPKVLIPIYRVGEGYPSNDG
jgi:hypothetical protein